MLETVVCRRALYVVCSLDYGLCMFLYRRWGVDASSKARAGEHWRGRGTSTNSLLRCDAVIAA